MRVLDCTVVVWKEQDGYVSKCPELGVASCGDTISEAVRNPREAAELYLGNAETLGLTEDTSNEDLFYPSEQIYRET
ncbi:MAG: type II toxin-antitoxin system HicB family antitoxin [Nitrospirae bacterium]|nr:type II toxin-antitoxin system HicB family antitoxin [Nitrospirota bacterium]